MNRRERLEQIVRGVIDAPLEQVKHVVESIMTMDRPDGAITHFVGPSSYHRLQVGDKLSNWTAPHEPIRIGNVVATTDAIGDMPQVCIVRELDPNQFETRSVQSMEP